MVCPVGLEPTILGLKVRCIGRYAMGALLPSLFILSSLYRTVSRWRDSVLAGEPGFEPR